MIAPDGSNPRRITGQVSGEHNLLPAWSPDGKRIAFAVRENRNWDLYLMNADGSGVTRLTEGPEDELYAQFLGDGTRIIYDRRGQLRVLDVATRESRVATIGPNDSRPAVSFDGNYVVYRSRKTGDFHHLWLMRAADALEGMVPDSKARQLTRGPDISDTTPVFSPDATRIAFVRQTRTGGSWGPGEIWVMVLK